MDTVSSLRDGGVVATSFGVGLSSFSGYGRPVCCAVVDSDLDVDLLSEPRTGAAFEIAQLARAIVFKTTLTIS